MHFWPARICFRIPKIRQKVLLCCPAGWVASRKQQPVSCLRNGKKGWLLVDPGSAAGLDASMAKAAERGENWFGYYWSPTALIGKYAMVPVSMGEWGGSKTGMAVS